MALILLYDRSRSDSRRHTVLLGRNGYRVQKAADDDDVGKQFCLCAPDLVMIGPLPPRTLATLLADLRRHDPDVPVLALFAADGEKQAASFLRAGGSGWLPASADTELIALTISRLLQQRKLLGERAWLRALHHAAVSPAIIGESRQARFIRSSIAAMADDDRPVLIAGEQGAGKALVARHIHARSRRADEPFMRLTCDGTNRDMDAELFGCDRREGREVRRGIFEIARGGTVLLEDVDLLDELQQERLAGVMQGKCYCRRDGCCRLPFRVRIMASTSRDPETLRERGLLNSDLYDQLKRNMLFIPPLRERTEDILPLVFHFLERYNREFGRGIAGLSKLVERLLLEYQWPGNVRELRNVMERAVILGGADLLYLEHLPLEMFAKAGPISPASFTFKLPTTGVDIEEVEKEIIRQALESCNGNQSRAARKLSLGIDAFRYRMKKFGFLK